MQVLLLLVGRCLVGPYFTYGTHKQDVIIDVHVLRPEWPLTPARCLGGQSTVSLIRQPTVVWLYKLWGQMNSNKGVKLVWLWGGGVAHRKGGELLCGQCGGTAAKELCSFWPCGGCAVFVSLFAGFQWTTRGQSTLDWKWVSLRHRMMLLWVWTAHPSFFRVTQFLWKFVRICRVYHYWYYYYNSCLCTFCNTIPTYFFIVNDLYSCYWYFFVKYLKTAECM